MSDPDHVQIVFEQIRDYNERGRTIQEACDLIARFTPPGVLAEARERYRRSVNAFQVGDKVLCLGGFLAVVTAIQEPYTGEHTFSRVRRYAVRRDNGHISAWYEGRELAFAE